MPDNPVLARISQRLEVAERRISGVLASSSMTLDADVIIVGSGPAGAAAALELSNRTQVLMLDVGHSAPEESPDEDRFVELLGERLEGMSIITEPYLSPKLRSPLFRYVTRSWRELSPINSRNFKGELSLALGGLANAWGSGLYEFDDTDLRGFPITYSELQPFYLRLTKHIGISGGGDEVAHLLGSSEGLLPPMPLAGPLKKLSACSERPEVKRLLARNGIQIGRQRLGVLTEPHRGRPAYAFDGKDFFRPGKAAIYNPAYTVRELEVLGKVRVRRGVLVKQFKEFSDGVRVDAIDLSSGQPVQFSARRLLLGAGAINSARIVLQSFKDYSTRLPMLENPVSFIPFIHLASLGLDSKENSFTGAQLALISDGPEHHDRVQGSFYNLSGVLSSDFLFDFPFSASGNLFCLAKVLEAMSVLQIYYSDAPTAASSLSLSPEGALEVRCPARRFGRVEAKLIKVLRKMGFWSARFLVRYAEGGSSFHYAGTLPVRAAGDSVGFSTDPAGRLNRCRHVYVVDASSFPVLPAKNLSLTIMANAMRVASKLVL
jgi:choline dehydrogenase-like flavoprotein